MNESNCILFCISQDTMAFSFVIILIFSVLGLVFDQPFASIKSQIPLLLSTIMFFMGITLSPQDFKRVLEKWKLILVGSGLQFFIMPLLAIGISYLLQLPLPITIGMALVGACPGGTASNVIVFLGKGNVALSISLTLFSTLLSPLLTPLILKITLGQNIDLKAFQMFLAIGKIVLIPIFTGLIINTYLPEITKHLSKVSSLISSIGIALIIGCVLALNKSNLLEYPIITFTAVILHNISGFILGYWGAKIFTKSEADIKTISIEVSMQNSGLAVSLAQQFFATYPSASLPGAIFSFWHNLSGISLAALFKQKKR